MTNKKQKNLPTTSDRSGFLDKVRRSKAASATPQHQTLAKAISNSQRPRLLFSMDATASREASWNLAKEITGAMFEAVPNALDVALAYHSSSRLQEVTPFSASPKVFLDKLQTVRCRAGVTALNPILDRASSISHLKALIYIGDCFEEDEQETITLAQQLRLKGTRCFLFHDASSKTQGYDIDSAHQVFAQIAQITQGALFPFDENSPELVKHLLEAISFYASQGISALEKHSKALPAAHLLLQQMHPQINS